MRCGAPALALALICGATAGTFVDLGPGVWRVGLVVSWILAVASYASRRPAALAAACGAGCLAAAALLADRAARDALEPPILRQTQSGIAAGCGWSPATPDCPDGPVTLEGRLTADAEPSPFGVALTIDVATVHLADPAPIVPIVRSVRLQPDPQTGTPRVNGAVIPSGGRVRVTVGGSRAHASRDRWRAGRLLRVTATLRRPQAYRNFGVANEEERSALRGVRLTGSVKSAALVEVMAHGNRIDEAAADARAYVRTVVARTVGTRDPTAAALVVAVLIGDRAGLAPDLEARLQRAGTFHVIAISGGNIGILAGLVLMLVRHAGLRPRLQAIGAIVVLAAYAAIVMGGASVARATLAALLYLAARVVDHRASPRAVMATTAGLVLLAWPLGVADVGLWLTFVASFAIVEQAGWLAARIASACRLPEAVAARAPIRAVLLLLAGTMAAEAALLPILAFVFGQLSAAGLALNFAAVPLMAVVQVAGMALVASSVMHPVLAWPPAALAIAAARGVTDSAGAVDAAPWLAPQVPYPAIWIVIVAVLSWWGVWMWPSRRGRRILAASWAGAIVAVVTGVTAGWPPIAGGIPLRLATCAVPDDDESSRDGVRVVFLDVGQGDATVIRWPTGEFTMVDAGGATGGSRFDVGARIVAPALWPLGVRRLDRAVLTHGDADHVGGAAAIIERFATAEIWEGVPVSGHAPMQALAGLAAARGIEWLQVRVGESRTYGRARLDVWHPGAPDWQRVRIRNDDSIVLEVSIGEVSIVLPGDIGPAVEGALVSRAAPAALRVVKAAHHGSRASSSGPWLDALAPRAAIVSAGRDNRHGHPAASVLERFAARGIAVFRTDVDGAIALDTDGARLRIRTCSGRTASFQIRSAPARPLSTAKLAIVDTGASGRVTNGTMR